MTAVRFFALIVSKKGNGKMNEEQIIAFAKGILEKGNMLFPSLRIKFSEVTFHFRLRARTAGIAGIRGSSMSLNFNMVLAKAYPEEFKNTVIHEVAHLFGFNLGDYGHGPKWNYIFKMLGGNGEKFHNMANPTFVKYTCDCGHIHNITPIVHKKMLQGSRYRCSICKSILRIAGKT